MFSKITVVGSVVFVLFLSGCTTVRVQPDKKKAKRTTNHYYIMSPNVQIKLQKFSGIDERLYVEESNIKVVIDSVVRNRLTQLGYSESESVIIPDSLNYEYKVRFRNITEKMDAVFQDLYDNIRISKKKAYNTDVSLGVDIQYFTSYCNADVLVFTKMIGFNNSLVVKTMNIANMSMVSYLTNFAVPPMIFMKPKGNMLIAAVDATSGDILWTNYSSLSFFINSKAIAGKVHKMIKDFDKTNLEGRDILVKNNLPNN